MTKLMKEVLAKLSKLSPERQDELAAWLLAEMAVRLGMGYRAAAS